MTLEGSGAASFGDFAQEKQLRAVGQNTAARACCPPGQTGLDEVIVVGIDDVGSAPWPRRFLKEFGRPGDLVGQALTVSAWGR